MILKGESAEEFNRKADDCKCWLDSKQRILSSDCSVHNQPLKVEVRKADENYMTSNITKKVIKDLIESDKKGLEEYGVTVDRKDYSLRDWLQEAYEETCDTAKYLKAAIEKIDRDNDRESKT